MKQWLLISALAFMVGLPAATANTWSYTFTNTTNSFLGSGTLVTGSDLGGGTYWATSGEGSFTGISTTSPQHVTLLAGGPNSTRSPRQAFDFNNMLYYPATPSTYLDGLGLALRWSSIIPSEPSYELNIFSNGGANNYELYTSDSSGFQNNIASGTGTFSLTATPEPGFYGVLALGLGGLFVGVRRRRRA